MIRVSDKTKIVFMADATDGDWQPVTLPTGVDAKGWFIQVHDNSTTTFAPLDSGKPFHFTHEDDGDHICVDEYGLYLESKKTAGEVVGYVRAAAGNKVALMAEY